MTAVAGIEEVGPWVVDQFETFVDSVGDTVTTVWDKIRYGVTKAGQFVLNGFGLRYSARFGEWLVSQFGLTSNSSSSVMNPSEDCYLPTYFPGMLWTDMYPSFTESNGTVVLSMASSASPNLLYFGVKNSDTSANMVLVRCDGLNSSTTYYWARKNLNVSSNPAPVGYSISFPSYDSSSGLYYNLGSSLPISTILTPVYDSVSLGISFELNVSGITITSGTLDVPQVGDYSDDDGIIIDGIGSWGDSLQDIWDWLADHSFPNSLDPTVDYTIQLADTLVDSLVSEGVLTTENSPYGLTPPGFVLPDLHFSSLWHYVTDWVTSMSSGLALIGGIMFSLPFVSAFYAVLVILIVLSVWRLLKHA